MRIVAYHQQGEEETHNIPDVIELTFKTPDVLQQGPQR